MTTIDVSAELGGLDADQATLPHFRALKSALKGRSFEGFPFPELAFILRVDGEVSSFGLSGPGHIDFDKKGQWVSVDIGIPTANWVAREASEVSTFIAGALMASVALLREQGGHRLKGTDWGALEIALQAFCAAYAAEFRSDA
jgi:hypothetical protein